MNDDRLGIVGREREEFRIKLSLRIGKLVCYFLKEDMHQLGENR